MLGVDFYDPTTQQLIWRGSATQTLNPSGNQEEDAQKLNKAEAKLLKHFPPQSRADGTGCDRTSVRPPTVNGDNYAWLSCRKELDWEAAA